MTCRERLRKLPPTVARPTTTNGLVARSSYRGASPAQALSSGQKDQLDDDSAAIKSRSQYMT